VTGAAEAGHRRRAIRLVFLIHALATGSMFTRIPDLQQGLGIDAGVLGLTFIGQPVGAIVMFLFSSRLVERVGTRPILLLALPLMAIGVLLMALAPSAPALFLAIAAFSALFAVSNVAMNVEADRVEAATGRRLMNSCHGIWSLGQLAVFTFGVLARGWQLSPALHFGLIVPVIVAGTLLVVLPLHAATARSHAAAALRRRLALPSAATVRLLGFALGGALVEAAARNWSVIYSRDSFSVPDWADALPLPVFVAAIAFGRFFADGWITRYRPAPVGRALMGVALGGLVLVVFAPGLPVALCGFVLLGLGVCTAFPASTSAAAQIGDRPSSENVAALTLSVQVVMLGAPALMGLVADSFGIRVTFAVIAPMLVVAMLLARALEPRPVVA
jgi:MFS family permease